MSEATSLSTEPQLLLPFFLYLCHFYPSIYLLHPVSSVFPPHAFMYLGTPIIHLHCHLSFPTLGITYSVKYIMQGCYYFFLPIPRYTCLFLPFLLLIVHHQFSFLRLHRDDDDRPTERWSEARRCFCCRINPWQKPFRRNFKNGRTTQQQPVHSLLPGHEPDAIHKF